jgi:hypothetical protein
MNLYLHKEKHKNDYFSNKSFPGSTTYMGRIFSGQNTSFSNQKNLDSGLPLT